MRKDELRAILPRRSPAFLFFPFRAQRRCKALPLVDAPLTAGPHTHHRDPSNIRNFVSLGVSFSFLLLLPGSVVLRLEPESRIASWIDWSFLLLDKEQWSAVHITGGTLFLLLSFWHMALNIRHLRSPLTVGKPVKNAVSY